MKMNLSLSISPVGAVRTLSSATRRPPPPEGRRAPLQVIEGNYERLNGACPWWDAMIAGRQVAIPKTSGVVLLPYRNA